MRYINVCFKFVLFSNSLFGLTKSLFFSIIILKFFSNVTCNLYYKRAIFFACYIVQIILTKIFNKQVFSF